MQISESKANSNCSNNPPEMPLRMKQSWPNHKEASIKVPPSVTWPPISLEVQATFRPFLHQGNAGPSDTRRDLYFKCFFVIWSTFLRSKRHLGRVIWTFWIGHWFTHRLTNSCMQKHAWAHRGCCIFFYSSRYLARGSGRILPFTASPC